MTHTPGVDAALTIGLFASFGLLVTMHVVTVYGVFRQKGPLAGAASFVVAPLAPYFAARSHMPARAILWGVSALAYVAMFFAARS